MIFRRIKDILSAVSNGLHARIEFSKKNKEEQKELIDSHQKKIAFLTEECKKVTYYKLFYITVHNQTTKYISICFK